MDSADHPHLAYSDSGSDALEYACGSLPTDIFSMLVIMALVSTFMAPPLIRWLMKGQESLATRLGEPSAARATS